MPFAFLNFIQLESRSELGWSSLDIAAVNLDHVGVYTLHIENSEGEAASSASVKVAGIGEILGDTKHEESWRQIQILEAPKPREPSPPPAEYPAPTFQTQILVFIYEELIDISKKGKRNETLYEIRPDFERLF